MEADFSTSPKLEDLEIEDIPHFIEKQREFFSTGVTYSFDFRRKQLKNLYKMLLDNQDKIIEAVHQDMGRGEFEGYGADIGVILREIKYNLKHLKKWMKPRKVSTGIALFKSQAHTEAIPLGVSLIVSAWNYPFFTLVRPLVSSIAAGNTAILKPSELSTESSKLIDSLIHEYFPSEYIEVIPGGIETGQALLRQRFDLIIFTGSTRVGTIYAEAAAKHLTPIILELGGKSPTIVDKSAKLAVAAERIAMGKLVNASQTCIAPDYLIVHEEIKDELIQNLKETIQAAYQEDIPNSPDYARIINEGHFNRIHELYSEVKDKVIFGGDFDKEQLYVSPTLIDSPSFDSKIMQNEIFGPVLPILTFRDVDDIRDIVSHNPDPLAMYIFSEDKHFIKAIKNTIRSGDLGINDAALHGAVGGLKFGGVGNSGMGGYAGKIGFDRCSHHRSVFTRSTLINLPFTKPPYTNFKKSLLKFFMK